MQWYCSKSPVFLTLSIMSVNLSLIACAPAKQALAPPAHVSSVQDVSTAQANNATLIVGTKQWNTSTAVLEEGFFPLAVRMHNNSTRPICGGVQTATLHSHEGGAVSAVLPTSVVTRLFGPLASVEHEFPQRPVSAVGRERRPMLLRVQGRLFSGGGIYGGATSPFAPFSYSSPFSSPPSSLYSSPFRSPYASPYFAPYPSPYSSPSPSPFSSPYLSPYSSPFLSPFSVPYSSYLYSPFYPYSSNPFSSFSRYTPYDYGYALPPVKPLPPPLKSEQPKIDHALLREIFSAAFASRPLEPQEERTGFLFFPRPISPQSTLTLVWSWYDCVTHELIAHLSVPVTNRHP